MDGYIGGDNTGVRDVCQHLALDLKPIRGDPVREGGGEGESLIREERSQGIPHL